MADYLAYYSTLKAIHVAAAFSTLALFLLRAAWAIGAPARLRQPWVRVVPHIIDTLLLLSAIGLVMSSAQYPFQQPWLSAKILALPVYIVLGSLALKRAPGPRHRLAFTLLALLVFCYILAVAFSKNPWPAG